MADGLGMWVLIVGGVIAIGVLARPLVTIYRASVPTLVRTEDPAAAQTAFTPGDRTALAARSFGDAGVHVIDIGGVEVLLHLLRRPADGTIVSGLSSLAGADPAHYVTTLLGDGTGWVDSRRTDRTPGPPGEFVQVSPGTTIEELIADHDAALAAVLAAGARPAIGFDAFGVHLQQGQVTRQSIRRNPFRWLVALARQARRPDERRDLADDPTLAQRLTSAGLV